jgi:PAS domain S-box-containing protein
MPLWDELSMLFLRTGLSPERWLFMQKKAKILASLAGMVLLVMAGITFTLRALHQTELAGALRQQSYHELNDTAQFVSALKDAETGYRGYLLTQDKAFLQPYLMVRDTLEARLTALGQPTLSDEAMMHLDTITPLVATSLASMRDGIGLSRQRGLQPAAMEARLDQGKRWMDQIRVELQAFTQSEEDALARNDARFQAQLRTLLGIICATSILTLTLALLFAFLLYREAERRIKDAVLLETRQILDRQANQLRWTEESFRLMVESVVDCSIVMLDPEGRVLTWNSGAQRIKGFTTEAIVGQNFSRFYAQEEIDEGRPQEALALATTHGRFETQGWRLRKDGSNFWASVILTAIRDHDGTLRGFAKLTQDLTERTRVAREVQEARTAAEAANLAKSNFLSSMSNELRTPLNAILGFAQLLETEVPPPRPAQKGHINHILKAGWHLLALVNEILDLSRVESGQLSLSQEPVCLGEVLAECQSMIEPQASGRGITLHFPAPALPRFVLADRTRLKQVLLNLLSNAIKYNAVQGTVEVVCLDPKPGRIRVAIRDQGPGLRPEQVAQLFQPFNRLGQEAGKEEGSGIGLVVAKRLVELMDGEIGVASTLGAGSEFWFELNATAAPELTPEAEAPASLPAAPEAPVSHVLYVEDNPANLMLVELIIQRHPDLHLLTAIDGGSGIDLARSTRPSIILMDINLPDMSGYEALQQLRADPATAGIRVIALSANAKESDIERGLAAGFYRFITKPIRIDEFMGALREALGSAPRG